MIKKQKKNNKPINLKGKEGITLIALVITIIVLLILAGVTIGTLTGDNGLLVKAGEVKQTNEESTALERIQVEVAGSYGLDGNIDLEQLNKNLKNINGLKYNDQNIILDGENKNTIKELPVEVFIENNSIFIDKDGNVLDWKNADLINSKIGNVVNGYSAADLERQLFYSTPVETYLISKTLAKTNWSVPLNREKQSDDEEEYKYKGLEDVKKLEYGSKWNKKWLKKCINNQAKGDSAKVTAYMCDPINWKEYAIDGVANYAVGGPTLELLIASYNKSQGTNIELLDEDIISTNGVELYKPNALIVKGSLSVNNGVYNSGQNYRLSTPLNYYGYYTGIIDGGQGRLDRAYWHDSNIGARTIVSIPTSKISINGDTVTVNP